MEFRTELLTKPSPASISLYDNIITLGSCFADDIGKKLLDNKFRVLANPFGTIYNPISIHRLINLTNPTSIPSPEGFIEREGSFYHHDFHSDWNGRSIESLNQKLKEGLTNLHQALLTCNHLIITYGTAWVYELKNSKTIVSNCNKVSQNNFSKFLLTQRMIVESFENFYAQLKKLNSNCQIILTVSPVRHVKDTTELNSVSKSILRSTCHELTETFNDVRYFPAFEIMMDDLRDYRFYKPDMIHPTSQAVDYIWEKFGASYFNTETLQFIRDWSNIEAALQHRPFHPESKSYQEFLKDVLRKIIQLKNQVNVDREIEMVKEQLKVNST